MQIKNKEIEETYMQEVKKILKQKDKLIETKIKFIKIKTKIF